MIQDVTAEQAKAQLVSKVGALCEQQLEQLFAQLLDKADTVFFDLAQTATPKERQGFFESMRTVRMQRQTIEEEFRHQIHLILGRMPEPGATHIALRRSAELSLMDEEDLTENLAFEGMVKRALERHQNALFHLLSWYQYAYGSYEIQAEWLPVHPQQLGMAVKRSLRSLTLSARVKSVIYQLFESEVLARLGITLLAASQLFVESDSIEQATSKPLDHPPPLRQLSDSEHQQVVDYIEDLIQRGAAAPTPSITAQQVVDGVSAIQRHAPEMDTPRVIDLRKLLKTTLHTGAEGLGVINEELVGLVTDMFDHILNAKSLAEEFRLPIARMQLPLLKVAILDQKVFTDRSHPARQLVNEFAHAGLGFDSHRRGGDAILQKMLSIVALVEQAHDADAEWFEKCLAEFQLCVRDEFRRSVILERRLHETEDGRARTEAAKRAAEQVLLPLLDGREISTEMLQLLDDVWRKLLQLEHVRAQGVSDSFRRYQVTAELLLQSVDSRLLHAGPDHEAIQEQVREQLREGFEAMGLMALDVTQWLQRVEAEQQRLFLLEKNKAAVGVPVDPASPPLLPVSGDEEFVIEELVIDVLPAELPATMEPARRESGNRESATSVLANNVPMADHKEFLDKEINLREMQLKGIGEAIWEMVDNLPVPCWVLAETTDGKPLRCKLCAKIAAVGRYIFVNRNGVKVLDMQRDEVALAVAEMRMTLIDDCALFDRALCDVIVNLRRLKAAEDQ